MSKERSASEVPTTSLKAAALAFARAGFPVFPCRPKGKQPLHSASAGGRGYLDATKDVSQVREWWTHEPRANIGLVPGMAGWIVIDVDGAEGRKSAKRLGLLKTKTRRVRTGRGFHLYFRHPGGTIGNKKLGAGIDVRADRGYVLAPPSIHPDGPVYAWIDPLAKILPLPPRALELLAPAVSEGTRNTELTSHLGALRRAGASEAQLIEEGLLFNRNHCDPPISADEVRSVARSVARYPVVGEDPHEVLTELNRRFAVVRLGAKGRVMQEDVDDLHFLPKEEFRFLLSNRFVASGPPPLKPAADYWLKHPQRRQYDRVVFEPGKPAKPDVYNLWRRWGIEPRKGKCSLFLAHLRDNVCSGDEELFRWVISWFADILQNPTVKPDTALVLRGRQGTGKTLVGKVFGKLIGDAYELVASPHRVTGQFNAHLERCLLLQADEAFWAGDRQAEGVLKDLITNDVQWIERKGVDAIKVANHMRLLVTSNAQWVIPAAFEERRFCVVDVAETNMQDKEYFGAILHELESGGYEALMHFCLNLPLDDVDLRTIPQTKALAEQKVASLSPEFAWWLDILSRGVLPGDTSGSGIASRRALFNDYIEHSQRIGIRRRSIETQLGKFLRSNVPRLRNSNTADNTAAYEFPKLKVCRKAFANAVGQLGEWSEPGAWQKDSLDRASARES